MNADRRCLLVYPECTSASFWNYRATCELTGARYPAAPLGLITVAAMLPSSWDLRLVDCNVQTLHDEDIEWADLVFTGGMISQQRATLSLIERVRGKGRTIVVGGPDATSSPHLYYHADHLVLGEAEVTLPRWLADLEAGVARPTYRCEDERADLGRSPRPRFDLLRFDRYLHVGVQFARGCPFRCEFCDIIELFGRVPRMKGADQMLAELQALYDLGYRGHVDFVDDNLIGNRRELAEFLVRLREWQEEHRWPFEFTTEVSINLADDERLLTLMQEVGFVAVFVGIESPDEKTLRAAKKGQNTKRDLAESVRKLYSYGIAVNAGYILGFDTEDGNVAEGVLELIEASAVPVNMVGLLFALPGTQLARRLQDEGRLSDRFDVAHVGVGDQCTGGLNFRTRRPQAEILEDYRRIIAESYAPEAYFGRVRRMGRALDCSKKQLHLPLRFVLKDLRAFGRLIWRMGFRKRYRFQFWRTLLTAVLRNPRSVRQTVALMALYLHFGEFRKHLFARIQDMIESGEAGAGAGSAEDARPARSLRPAV